MVFSPSFFVVIISLHHHHHFFLRSEKDGQENLMVGDELSCWMKDDVRPWYVFEFCRIRPLFGLIGKEGCGNRSRKIR